MADRTAKSLHEQRQAIRPVKAREAQGRTRPAGARSRAGTRFKGIHGRVIDGIGENIVRGVYSPGSLLPREAELMEIYRASRSSVREAIKVLSAKGLVETRQRVGTWVCERSQWNIFDSDILHWHAFEDFDDSMLKDLIEMRQLVEPPAARFAALRASLEDIALIGERCEDMKQSMDDMQAYAAADVQFHLAVFNASHNAMLRRFALIVADFLQISFQIQQRALDAQGDRLKEDYAEHLKLYRAINRGDAAAAEALMMDIIMDGKESLLCARRLSPPQGNQA